MVVVPQPVLRPDRRRVLRDRRRQESIRVVKFLRARVEPGKERAPANRVGCDAVQAGERDGMSFELVLTKELRLWRTVFVNKRIVEKGVGRLSQRRWHPHPL
jgi:hypothetical protein